MSNATQIKSSLDEIEAGIEILKTDPDNIPVQGHIRKQKLILKSCNFQGKMPRLPRNYAKHIEN